MTWAAMVPPPDVPVPLHDAEIAQQIHAPKHGVMPAWNFRLSDATLKQLAVYVHSLGGGE